MPLDLMYVLIDNAPPRRIIHSRRNCSRPSSGCLTITRQYVPCTHSLDVPFLALHYVRQTDSLESRRVEGFQSQQIRQVRHRNDRVANVCCTQQALINWYSKAYSEYFDPCQEAADKSIKCLKRNGGERAMCSDFFQ